VLKNQAEKEKKMPSAKHVKTGNWKPVEITEVEEQDIDMTDIRRTQNVRFHSPKQKQLKSSTEGSVARVKLQDQLKEAARPELMLEKILDQPVQNITTREVLANSPALLRMVFKQLDTPKDEAAADGIRVGSLGVRERTDEAFYSVATPKMKVRVNDEILATAMIDTGAEINVMTMELVERSGLAMTPSPPLTIVGHGGERRQFEGVCENTPVQIGGITTYVPVFVVGEADIPLILGQPYIFETGLTISREADAQYITVSDSDSGRGFKVKVLKANDVGNRVRSQIFPLN
jgi:hypothetical protein